MTNRTVKIYPWYSSISGDLLFFVAINTVYLTTIKNFDALQISLMNTIAMAFTILMRRIFLKVIFLIGNENSIRLGSGLLLLSGIFYTIGQLYLIYLACVLYTVGLFFIEVKVNILKNNLQLLNRENDYMKIDGKSKFIFSLYTCIIAIIVPFMYSFNEYFPMFACIFCALIAFILSFFLKDCKVNECSNLGKPLKFKFSKLFLLIVGIMILFVPLIVRGSTYIKLLAQDFLEIYLEIDVVVYLIRGMVLLSRIVRMISAFAFSKYCNKLSYNSFVYMGAILFLGFALVIVGFLLNSLWISYVFMLVGFSILFGLMDPLQLSIKNIILNNYKGKQASNAITINYTAITFGQLILSGLATLLLLGINLFWTVTIFCAISLIALALLIKLCFVLKSQSDVGQAKDLI